MKRDRRRRDGINRGTRLCATVEAPIPPNVKQAILAIEERASLPLLRLRRQAALRVAFHDIKGPCCAPPPP